MPSYYVLSLSHATYLKYRYRSHLNEAQLLSVGTKSPLEGLYSVFAKWEHKTYSHTLFSAQKDVLRGMANSEAIRPALFLSLPP